jgi:hypothetical protein
MIREMQIEILIALGSCLVLVLISGVYFRLGKTLAPRTRIAASAHAFLVAAILPYGLAVEVLSTGYASPMAQLPIALLLLLAAASIAFSVWVFRDKLLLHLAHLITIALAIPFTILGSIAIVGWT